MTDGDKSDDRKSKDDKSAWEEVVHDVPKLPKINIDRDFIIAKGYLQQLGCRNETVWGHLNDIINHVLKEKPPDCMRYFEDMSRELRIKKFFLNKECDIIYKEIEEEPKDVDESKQLLRFYRRVECLYESDSPYEDKFGTQDFLPIFKLLEEAGVGFPYTEIYNLQMAIRFLVKTKPIEKIKLWGKVLGTVRDYIIVETELTPEGMSARLKQFNDRRHSIVKETEVEDNLMGTPSTLFRDDQDGFFREDLEEEELELKISKRKLEIYQKPPLPIPQPTKDVIVPSEPPGQGVNRKVYYVCNDPCEVWHELPDITPEHIVRARFMRRFLTGILENDVPGYPIFPGTEKEYLRAQIARITHATHASPLGFYSSGGEEETAIELEEGQLYNENVDYQPLPVRDLMDPTFEFWVHHEPYILKQGRTEFWQENPDAQEYEMEEMGGDGKDIEIGPPILTSLSGDVMDEPTPCWALRRASTLLSEDTVVVLKSNLWPGALTALKDRLFVNFYVGWAIKSASLGFNPYLATNIMSEYELGPEIMEMTDPTPEMEEFRWLQLHPKDITEPTVEEEEASQNVPVNEEDDK